MGTLHFIQNYGITAQKRKRKKSTPSLITWDGLQQHFQRQLEGDVKKIIRETKYAKANNPEYPMEARLMFGNANVPFGYVGGNTDDHLVKSIPCKNVEQGKETLMEVIDAIKSDNSIRKVLANFFKGRTGFDDSTIPSELLGG